MNEHFTAEIHRPKEGRRARNWGVFFGGIALMIAVVVGVPAIRAASRNQNRYNAEQLCRARINNATATVNASIILDFTDLSLASLAAADRGAAVVALTADRALAAELKPIQLAAVDICHKDPGYLPPAP